MKRIISLLLCAALIFSFVIPVYAETGSTEAATEAIEILQESQPATEAAETVAEESDAASEATEAPSAPTEDSTAPVETTAPAEETTAPAEEPTESTDAAEETTEATEPATEATEAEWNMEETIAQLSACTTQAQKDAIFEQLTQEQIDALYEAAPALFVYIPSGKPAVNVTNPGSFLAPIEFPAVALFSRMLMTAGLNALAEGDDSALQLNKTSVLKAGTTDTYTITLEAYTTGEVKVNQVSTPCDIVLVLDESGSMDYAIGKTPVYNLNTEETYYFINGNNDREVSYNGESWGYSSGRRWTTVTPKTSAGDATANAVQFYVDSQTRNAAIVEAVNAFLTSLNADNANLPEGVTAHRVGMIGFSGNNNARIIRPLSTESTGAIGANTLNTNGGTYVDDGLNLVDDVFDAAEDTSGETRNRVVILFTDGNPGSGSWGDDDYTVAANAVNIAKDLKADISTDSGYGCTIYTVGIFEGANPSDTTGASNSYMNGVSSNYKEATAARVTSGTGWNTTYSLSVTYGDRATTGNYYLSASDSDSLTQIFKAIAQQTAKPGVELDSTTQVIDTVTPYFDIPADATGVTVQVADYDGTSFGTAYAASGVTASVDSATSQIKVTGFDFNNNFVATTGRDENDPTEEGDFYGRKLIITFNVTAKEEFWGGNNVPTNVAESSGLYIPDEDGVLSPVENGSFGVSPEVNVPVNVPSFNGIDKNIYLLGMVPTVSELCDFVLPTGEDAWKIAYVNVSGPTIDKTVTNTDDTTGITVRVEATPEYDGANASGTVATMDSATATANVYVYKPVMTWQDSEIEINQTADYADNYVSVEWKHGETVADTAMGEAPELSYTYEPGETAFLQDTNVSVTVKIGDTDVTSYVTFEHEDCGFDGCDWEAAKEAGAEFIVHIKSFDLTITKTGWEEIDENQTFLFNITGPNGFVMQVVIQGNGSATIKNLPVGEYTITEDQSWSWRYEAVDGEKTINASNVKDGVATVSFENKRTEDKWLSGSAVAENIFQALTSLVGE